MLETNPFSILAETVSPFAMQSFIIAMIVLIALGTIIQMIHHKKSLIFLTMQKKQNFKQQEK
jgi:cell division protein FtsN